jgi:hypothetical protein
MSCTPISWMPTFYFFLHSSITFILSLTLVCIWIEIVSSLQFLLDREYGFPSSLLHSSLDMDISQTNG